jgi:transcriptional regulator with XRE-family HTH domain
LVLFEFRGGALEHNEQTQGNEAFGAYLRKLREGRRLSLDAVEELSSGFPEKVTKSHLSRIENGLALPTFPRLMAMSHIYGMPIASMAERYEIELRREMKPVDLGDKSVDEALRDAEAYVYSGDFNDALLLIWALLDRHQSTSGIQPETEIERLVGLDLRLRAAICLIKLGRCEYAKALCEDVLGAPGISERLRIRALFLFASASHRLQRYTVALLALDECDRSASTLPATDRLRADVLSLRGVIQETTGRPADALQTYERARQAYEEIGEEFERLNMEAGIGSALLESGRPREARTALESVLKRIEHGHHERLRAIVLSNLAVLFHRAGSLEEAEAFAIKSNLIARPREYSGILFRNCFYLWQIAKARGDAAAVRLNERTLMTVLGRVEEFLPEIAEFRLATNRSDA